MASAAGLPYEDRRSGSYKRAGSPARAQARRRPAPPLNADLVDPGSTHRHSCDRLLQLVSDTVDKYSVAMAYGINSEKANLKARHGAP